MTTYSLFAPSNIIKLLASFNSPSITDNDKLAIKEWLKRYLCGQIISSMVFTYWFPDINIRFYFDHYLIEKLKDINYNFSDLLVEEIKYEDFENNTDNNINTLVTNFLIENKNKLLNLDNYNFNNFFEKLICAYNLININCEYFIYKLKDCFIESINGIDIPITNGYIGQLMRYISVRQDDYIYGTENIRRPKFIIFRDAHSTTPGINDTKWINELYENTKNHKEIFYLVGASLNYDGFSWHDFAKCGLNNLYMKKAIAAGVNIFVNRTDDKLLLEDYYAPTIGLGFTIFPNNKLFIRYDTNVAKYDWDESNLIISWNDEKKKKTYKNCRRCITYNER